MTPKLENHFSNFKHRFRPVIAPEPCRPRLFASLSDVQSRPGLDPVPFLEITPSIAETVAYYIDSQMMPADPGGDALHLAIASTYKCDFILTWNCRHLANANKFARIRQVNAMLGLFVPSLVTPLQLLGDTNNDT